MTLFARYTFLVERQLGDSDYRSTSSRTGPGRRDRIGHDGTGLAAAKQVCAEMQEAWESGAIDGHFACVTREIVDTDDPEYVRLTAMPQSFDDDPDVARVPVSEALRAFFGVEIRNERDGGVSPATLGSAFDSWSQAPEHILLSWLGLPDSSSGAEKLYDELSNLALLITRLGPDQPLVELI